MLNPSHCILMYTAGEDYVARRAPHRAAHLGLVQAASDRGEIVIAGALADPDSGAAEGAALVFRGDSHHAAEAAAKRFALADPYVRNQVVTGWRVLRWMTVAGDGAKMPKLEA